ncbi:putative HTH-type transcriptional regulator YobV [Geobacter sp. OR-1]|uniref:helix-turn-helix transcriptional regulator n=1 Tax=Geobacter sp. OR-1 TaxID=1266765 RepID=UPI0005439263|nr:YafY family protein [Geobacter sp. OR-1]GAM09464.1 putative HTH-type transcriptional regulator YobV [Geobacter sp. OR-1]
MNKAERLFQLVMLLRSRRTAMTAEAIATTMGVSVRTVYRDVQSLTLSGVPVEGEPGVGYLLHPGNHLPPLIFTPDELQALIVGSRMVQAFTDPELAQGARSAELKIRSILTEPLQRHAEQQPYRIPVLERDDRLREVHGKLRRACENRQKIRAVYLDEKQEKTERIVWPLGIVGWSGKWTLLAWCELRSAYRNFRFDRFEALEPLEENFKPTDNISIAHYLQSVVGMRDPG